MKTSYKTKNTKPMFYALYKDNLPIYDADGNLELETKSGYDAPVAFDASISTGQSYGEETPFGMNVSYDRVITSCDISLPIDENSLIWYKNQPVFHADGTVNSDSADYAVAALPLDGLDAIRIAVKKRSKKIVEEEVTTDTDKTPDSGAEDSTEGGSTGSGSDGGEDDGF